MINRWKGFETPIWKDFKQFSEKHQKSAFDMLTYLQLIRFYHLRNNELKKLKKLNTYHRSHLYFQFLRTFSCVICGGRHAKIRRFNKKKNITHTYASDYRALPVCSKCVGDKRTLQLFKVHIEDHISTFNRAYIQLLEM